jgi:hypothetical protein
MTVPDVLASVDVTTGDELIEGGSSPAIAAGMPDATSTSPILSAQYWTCPIKKARRIGLLARNSTLTPSSRLPHQRLGWTCIQRRQGARAHRLKRGSATTTDAISVVQP